MRPPSAPPRGRKALLAKAVKAAKADSRSRLERRPRDEAAQTAPGGSSTKRPSFSRSDHPNPIAFGLDLERALQRFFERGEQNGVGSGRDPAGALALGIRRGSCGLEPLVGVVGLEVPLDLVEALGARTLEPSNRLSAGVTDLQANRARAGATEVVRDRRSVGRVLPPEERIAVDLFDPRSVGIADVVGDGGLGLEQECSLAERFLQLLHDGDVHDPDRAAKGPDDEIALARLEDERAHHGMGKVSFPSRPVLARVDGHEEPRLGADVEHARVVWIFTEDVGRSPFGKIVSQARPRCTEARRAKDIGTVVVEIVEVEGDVGGSGVGSRGLDLGDDSLPVASIRQVGVDAGPAVPAVAAHVNRAVVGPGPQDVGVERRLGEGVQGAVAVPPFVDSGKRRVLLCREVSADRFTRMRRFSGGRRETDPATEDVLRSEIEDVGVGRGQDHGRRPVPAKRSESHARSVLVGWLELGARPGPEVEPRRVPVLLREVDDVGVARVRMDGHPVTLRTELDPVVVGDAFVVVGLARPGPGGGVLHAAVNPVGDLVVHVHLVELTEREHRLHPCASAVAGDAHAAVATEDEVLGVVGVDP